ncbi:hypothetical protein ACWDG1_33530 [Streptomyces sp. NPDC001177]
MVGKDRGGGAAGEHMLAGALARMEVGEEPPLRDLVTGAIVRGTLIRRRRRIGVALGSAALAAVVVAAAAVIGPRPPQSREARPATSVPASVLPTWHPSLALLRQVVPSAMGTVKTSHPGRPMVPGRSFRLTSEHGLADLYVAVLRTVEPGTPDSAGICGGTAASTSGWDGYRRECGDLETTKEGRVLNYQVVERMSSPPGNGAYVLRASGLSLARPDGWTVQVITGGLDAAVSHPQLTKPGKGDLYKIATDPRLFDAFRDSRPNAS